MKRAYSDYCNEAIENSNQVINFEDWCELRKLQSSQFQFWYLILSMELIILALIQSFREANFVLHKDALSELYLTSLPTTISTTHDGFQITSEILWCLSNSSTAKCVDDARLELFARKQRSYKSIPPTRAALMQHLKRSAYQAKCIWSQATVCQPETLSPADWGWTKESNIWKTCWTTLPPIATSCQELTKCGCKMECRGNCKCYRFNLPCTALCSCTCLD